MLVFEVEEKTGVPEKNLSAQRREPTTNSTHIWRRRLDLNSGHIDGRGSALTTALTLACEQALCLGKKNSYEMEGKGVEFSARPKSCSQATLTLAPQG